MKHLRILTVAAALLLTVLFAGCAPVNDAQYQLIFGKSASELIPTVGNAAYSSRSLVEEEEEAEEESAASEDAAETEETEEEEAYVDPTAGLDCSED